MGGARRPWDVEPGAAHVGEQPAPCALLARTDLPTFDASALLGHASFPITLSAPLLFGAGDRRVLARSIAPTTALLGIHAAVHAAADSGDDTPHTTPGEWSPHVTLARRLRTSDLAAALAHVGGEIHGHAVSVRRWDAVAATTRTIRVLS